MTRLLLLLMITMSACSSMQNKQVLSPTLQLQTSYRVEWIGERPLMDYSYLNIVLDRSYLLSINNAPVKGFGGVVEHCIVL